MLVMAGASMAVSYWGQQETAARAEDAANRTLEAQNEGTRLQQEQINEQASDEMSALARDAQAASARLRVAAGESGVGGVSLDRAEREIKFNESQDITTIQKNARNAIKQSQSQAGMNAAQANATIGNSRPNIYSSIGTGLQVYNSAGGFKAAPKVPAK